MRRTLWIAAAPLVFVVACANIWGFGDVTLGVADGGAQDATTDVSGDDASEASFEAALDAPDDSTQRGDSPVTTEAGGDAGPRIDAGTDTGPDAMNDGAPDTGDAGGGDAAVDGAVEAGNDGGGDAAVDGAVEAGNDGGGDAGGNCGTVCSVAPTNGKPVCVNGTCSFTCNAGFSACNGACANEQTDNSNCGGCGAAFACAAGTTCQAGKCACPAGQVFCGGSCVSNTLTSSCGGCNVCSAATGAPACNGTTCSYTCNAGRADCNASTAPDIDGCECATNIATPGCCGTVCQTQHDSGLSSPAQYYDCNATGNSGSQAISACTSSGATGCADKSACCALLGTCLSGPNTHAVCGTLNGTVYCWQYSGSHPGTVQSGSSSASCGSGSDPSWN